ncbi:MAG: hypothetical protein ACW98A_07145 [Candidatus Hodarchaeales archaeon]|jgi:hypothetical protein
MRKLLILVFIFVIFSSQVVNSDSDEKSVVFGQGEETKSSKYLKVDQSSVNRSEFSATVTILISSVLYWVSSRTLDIFINEINQAINTNFPNVTTKFVISNSSFIPDVVDNILTSDNSTKEYLITIGRNQAPFLSDDLIGLSWTNQSKYNNSVYKDVAFIDANVGQLSKYSYQDFNQTEAGFIAGVWGAFASKNQYAGVLMVLGPELGYSQNSGFVIMNSAFLSGTFTGFEYVRENYLNRAVFPILAKGMNQDKYRISLSNYYQELNSSVVDVFNEELAFTETELSALEYFDRGIDTIVSITNTGDEGLAQQLNEDSDRNGFFLNSPPISGLENNNAAFLYPNYTHSVLRQLDHWAEFNNTNPYQIVYKPNTVEYPFLNQNTNVAENEGFKLVLSDFNASNIIIPEEFLFCAKPGISCEPEQVEIIPGFEWISFIVIISGVTIRKRLKNKR